MTIRSRTLSWSAALRQIQADRISLKPGERHALQRDRGFVEIAARRASAAGHCRSLLKGGSYDRRGIMRLAIESARARREVKGESWRICLSAALKGTWQAAKAARSAAMTRGNVQDIAISRLPSVAIESLL